MKSRAMNPVGLLELHAHPFVFKNFLVTVSKRHHSVTIPAGVIIVCSADQTSNREHVGNG